MVILLAIESKSSDPAFMETSRNERDERDRDSRVPHFSCAFCHADRPKPFKICETCGESQPKGDSEEE